MNLSIPSSKVISLFFRFYLVLRRILPKRKCHAISISTICKHSAITKIHVINLDREPTRWLKMQKELSNFFDSSGIALLRLTERYAAVDANQFLQDTVKDANIDPFYTLKDQLFVEPQPLVFPTQLELDAPIRMTRPEIAVALSHINIWKKVANGNHDYVLILEDDTWFHFRFAKKLDQAWTEIMTENDRDGKFDVLYVSYLEVNHGAPKSYVSSKVFRPMRGLWHLSGYVLSRKGAQKLLKLLPCRGPIDLWLNHHFEVLNVFATKISLINQRRDIISSNSYSVLPALTKIGAMNSEGASLFHIRPAEHPVFAFGQDGSGHSSLAMALSMLGYRCCSDFMNLPFSEMERLLAGKKDRIFNAYVNIASLIENIHELRSRYPNAKYIITSKNGSHLDYTLQGVYSDLKGADIAVLYLDEPNKWKIICEHLRCAPPKCSFPAMKDHNQRVLIDESIKVHSIVRSKIPRRDKSPWLIESCVWWKGFSTLTPQDEKVENGTLVRITDNVEGLNTDWWLLRSDTFTDNLALFRPSNVDFRIGIGALFSVKKEPLGVRNYSAASLCSRDQYLFGKFEANIQASNVPGVVTGIFLHRNSPRQEIDIEIPGNKPNHLLINVFYNPGDEGANFDYGYRGAPTYIELGFDASKGYHQYAIEWTQNEIRWLVDDEIVYKRVIWDPTPIPNLPMTFHINTWLSRSSQLAGRVNSKKLPAITLVKRIALEANSVNAELKPSSLQRCNNQIKGLSSSKLVP